MVGPVGVVGVGWALPAPELGAHRSRTYERPRGEVEEILAGIWQGLLKVERVGRNDNFFELGGHSLLAIQVISRVREKFKVELPLFGLFDAPTIRQLAQGLDTGEYGTSRFIFRKPDQKSEG